jgi:hypothetical protein
MHQKIETKRPLVCSVAYESMKAAWAVHRRPAHAPRMAPAAMDQFSRAADCEITVEM